jgi:hypothetical protein
MRSKYERTSMNLMSFASVSFAKGENLSSIYTH